MADEVLREGERLLRIRDVQVKTSLGRTSIYKFMSENGFPRPLQLGPGTVRWKESEIEEWIASRPRAG